MFVRALIVEGHACDCVWCEGSVRVAHAGHLTCVSRGLRRDGMMCVLVAAAFGEGFDPDTNAAGCAGLSVTQPHWAAQA